MPTIPPPLHLVRVATPPAPSSAARRAWLRPSCWFRDLVERRLAPAGVAIDGGRDWDLRVHDDRCFRSMALHGSLGFAESFVDGWWDTPRLDQLVCRLLSAGDGVRRWSWPDLLMAVRSRLGNRQRPSRAAQVAERHYDGEVALYRAMLGDCMVYSCGYWARAGDLAAAQHDKIELACRKLALQPGQRLLDIGCGWGEAARHAALRHGVEVVGITVSPVQAEEARRRCRGLPVEIRVQDYRALTGTFDRILSIGMFEHVGPRNYATFMQVARRCLRHDGRFLLHTIGGNQPAAGGDPWLDRHIFPNACLPAASQLAAAIEGRFVIEDWHGFGPDYDRTLMAWHGNLEAAWDRLPGGEDQRVRRTWRYYLLACAGSFRARKNQLWQVLLTPHGVPGGCPPVR